MIRDAQGNDIGQLVVTARLRTVQPSWMHKLGIKEESQRFTSVPNEKEQAGSAVLTLSGQIGTGGAPGGPAEGLGQQSQGSSGLQPGGARAARPEESAATPCG